MRRYFADAYFFLAVLSEDDADHSRAVQFLQSLDGRCFTTDWILTEVGDASCRPGLRARFVTFAAGLRTHPLIRIVRANPALFDEGLELFARYRDKAWSLTDCISFVVMRRYGLTDALTADHHFEQAGFRALFK